MISPAIKTIDYYWAIQFASIRSNPKMRKTSERNVYKAESPFQSFAGEAGNRSSKDEVPSMAGNDPQKQLLTLIRDFASERSQGERRVVGLKKRIQELRKEIDAANAELEDAKRCKETTEEELKGYEFELALNDTSIQTVEARISLIQDEISTVGSDLEALKKEEGASRDEFIKRMFEFNTKIRKFQETIACTFQKENHIGTSLDDGKIVNEEDTEVASRTVQDKLANMIAQTNMEEQEYKAEQNIHKQVQLELIDFERKVSLMEAIMKETEELQDLTRQTSELEEMCASLGEELQRRCVCPNCHLDNVEALGGLLQANEEN